MNHLKKIRTKLLTFFSNEIIHCDYKINENIVHIYFPEYNIAVEIYDNNQDILCVNEFKKYNNWMLININLNKPCFNAYTEIAKIRNSVSDVIKNKIFDNDKTISSLNCKIKRIHDTLLECVNLIHLIQPNN